MATASAKAYAKINLHLWVGKRRDDGYHPIGSIFQMVSLYDAITVTVQEAERFSCRVSGVESVMPEKNSMVEAARLFSERAGIENTVSISCVKRIPMGAGLGGGSSDAATVLRLLNRLTGFPFDAGRLSDIGLEVGCDVPFFLGTSTAAFVEGRGELVMPILPRDDLAACIIIPKDSTVCTARAFEAFDILNPPAESYDRAFLCEAYKQKVSNWPFKNALRAVVGQKETFYRELDRLVEIQGDCYGTLSGSGSAYCIIGEQKEKIEQLRRKIELIGHECSVYTIKCLHHTDSDDTVSL